jgi:hypothetical protein
MRDDAPGGAITHIGPLQVAITVMVVITALTHLYLGVVTTMLLAFQPAVAAGIQAGGPPLALMAALFYLNFAGYLALNTALYLPALREYQRITRWLLAAYAMVTIIAYFMLAQGHLDLFGYADKAIEALLIVLLLIEDRRSRHVTTS